MNKTNKKINIALIVDVLLHCGYFATTILTFYIAYDFGMIPATWLHMALALIITIGFISIVLAMKKIS